MRKLGVAGMVLVVLLLRSLGWADMETKTTVVVCPEVSQAPRLDGRVDPPEWAAAGCLSDFVVLGGRGLPRLPTQVYVMHTRTSLYIGARMTDDRPAELVANVTQRDGKVYEDDCLELFVDSEGTGQECAHFVVNSLGTKFDEYGHDVAENFDWNVMAAVSDTGWSVEMELPFEGAVAPLEGETWRLGVGRNAARAGELSTWGRHESAFAEPQAFGEMIFKSPLLTAQVDDFGDQLFGDNLALVTVHNLGPVPTVAKLNVVVMVGDRRGHYFATIKKDIPPRRTAQLYVPYKIRRCGPGWMMLSLTDERGTVAWRTAPLPINLPEVSTPLDEVLHAMTLAWRSWAQLSESPTKEALRRDLENLQREWSYLDAQLAATPSTPPERLAAIGVEAQRLKSRVDAAQERVKGAKAGASARGG